MTSDDLIFATLASLDAEPMTPVRQGASPMAVAAAGGFPLGLGGPAQPPVAAGKELTPSSAAAAPVAACESTDPPSGAGVDVPGVLSPGERKGRAVGKVGAATFTLPDTRVWLTFDDEPLPAWAKTSSWTQFFEVNVCGGLDDDEVGPAHCGSSAPHRWHDLLTP